VVERGLEQARKFNWRSAAEAILDLYGRAAGEPKVFEAQRGESPGGWKVRRGLSAASVVESVVHESNSEKSGRETNVETNG